MSLPPRGTPKKVDPSHVPPSLRVRIEAAVALARVEPGSVPLESRLAVAPLRRRLDAEAPRGEFGCPLAILAFALLKAGFDLTVAEALFGAVLVLAFWTGVVRRFGRHGYLRRGLRPLSPELLRDAGDVAGFGPAERAALAAATAPRADAAIRAEIERLLQEDARLVAAREGVGTTYLDPIRAERSRLKFALARAQDRGDDDAARAPLKASLALCERRHAAASEALAVAARIDAHRELILQTLRAADESLRRAGTETADLGAVRDRADALADEIAAVESAVAEMRAL